MLKKIILASAVLASSASFAMNSPAPYIGASLGVTANTPNNDGNAAYAAGSYRGVPFNVFLGYGGIINQSFYLAGELTGTLGTGDLQNNGLKTSYGIGGSIIPGVMLNDRTLGFLRVGVVNARFSKPGTNSTGGQFGAGLQTSLTQCVDLRAEYDFIAYRSVNFTNSGTAYSVSPRADQFNLGLIYKFD